MPANYLFINGFEHGAVGAVVTRGSPSVTTAQARTGAYSVGLAANAAVDKTLVTPELTLYSGVAVRPTSLSNRHILMFFAGTSREAHVSCVGDGGQLSVVINSTTVATGGQLTINTWTVLEARVTKVVGETTSVVITLYQDGVLVATGTSLAASDNPFNRVCIGSPTSFLSGLEGYYDDWTICTDGYPGRGGIELLVPSGAGSSTDLTPSAGANYAAVDEVPTDDDTTYVSGSTADDHDSYALSNLTLLGAVKAVQWNCRARLVEEGSGNIKRVLRSDGADYTGDVISIDKTYAWKSECFTNDPATGAAWERAAVDALEAGVMIV